MRIVKKPIFHILILIAAFLLAVLFRFIRLGVIPLSNVEAGIALQALAVGQRGEAVFGEHVAYVGLTGLDIFVFEASNFLARFWPALFGALIVFVPFLFRDRIGHWPASILAVVLAITPEMVGLSRIIGTPMIAFVSLSLAFGLLLQRKPILSGAAFALALMGGSGFWTGILLFGIGLIVSEVFIGQRILIDLFGTFKKGKFRNRFFLAWFLTIAFVGTGFFLAPDGLSGVFSGSVNFIRGFGLGYSRPFILRPLALFAYSLPAILFGFWGGIRALILREKLDTGLLILALTGLLYLFIYPGATPVDIIWVTLPLWTLAARAVFFVWRYPENNRFVMMITAILVVIVLAFSLLALRAMINPTAVQNTQLVTFFALFGGLILLIALILLVTYGWSEEIALSGLMIGLAVVVLFGMVSISVRSTGLNTEETFELWYPEEPQLSTRWLKISTNRVLDWNNRRSTPLEISIVDLRTQGMRWAMQEYDDVSFVPYSPPTMQPGILISDIMTQPDISNSYRGQDLIWARKALWEQMSVMQYLNWIITREAPSTNEEIIFWVRTDLMPDEQFSP